MTSDWVTLQKHPKIWRKKKISFAPFPPWCLKFIKPPCFSSMGQLQEALLESKLTAEQMSFLSLPFQRRGEHNCTFAAKHHQKKNPKNSPVSPSPETQKLNQLIQHYKRAILLSQSRKKNVEGAVVLSDRSGAGDRGWAVGRPFINFICSLFKVKLTNPFGVCCKVTHFSRKHPRQLPFSRMCHFLCSYNNILSKGIAVNLHIYICIGAVHMNDSTRNRQKAFC